MGVRPVPRVLMMAHGRSQTAWEDRNFHHRDTEAFIGTTGTGAAPSVAESLCLSAETMQTNTQNDGGPRKAGPAGIQPEPSCQARPGVNESKKRTEPSRGTGEGKIPKRLLPCIHKREIRRNPVYHASFPSSALKKVRPLPSRALHIFAGRKRLNAPALAGDQSGYFRFIRRWPAAAPQAPSWQGCVAVPLPSPRRRRPFPPPPRPGITPGL